MLEVRGCECQVVAKLRWLRGLEPPPAPTRAGALLAMQGKLGEGNAWSMGCECQVVVVERFRLPTGAHPDGVLLAARDRSAAG